MLENQKEVPAFIGLQQLADKWQCHRNTLSAAISRIKDQIPLYRKNQKLYSPAQYKKIAELLGFDI